MSECSYCRKSLKTRRYSPALNPDDIMTDPSGSCCSRRCAEQQAEVERRQERDRLDEQHQQALAALVKRRPRRTPARPSTDRLH